MCDPPIYEQISNVGYVTQKTVDGNNQLGGNNFSSAPVLSHEIPSQPVGNELRKPSDNESRKSISSLANDSVIPPAGTNTN